MNRKLWLAFAMVVIAAALTAGVLLWRDADGSPDAGDGRPAAEAEDGREGDEGSSAEESVTTVSDEPAKAGDQVSDAIAYELIDALKASGIEPVPGEALTLEYVERLDRVRVSGKFESDETTSYVLGFADGVWKVER